MAYLTTISKTDLARRTRQIVDRIRRGDTLIVESYGEEQIAMLDIAEYRILRAVAAYYGCGSRPAPVNDPTLAPQGLTEDAVAQSIRQADDPVQARWNRVMLAYLDGHISLGRAADLLALSRHELDLHFQRLDVPRRIGPETLEEAQAEVAAARAATAAQWRTV